MHHRKLENRLRGFQRRSTLSTQIPVPRNSREIRGVTLPQGPYIPKNMQDSFVRDEPIMFVDGYGRDGVSLADALDEDFNNLIGDGLMLANYAEAVIALRLEVRIGAARLDR